MPPPSGNLPNNDGLRSRAARLEAERAAKAARADGLAERARVGGLIERDRIGWQAQRSMALREAEWAKATQIKLDPKFFERLMNTVNASKHRLLTGFAGAGLLVVGGALALYAIRHMADPSEFFDDRSKWNEMLGDLKLSAWDVWITYFSEVSPYWKGHASETVQRYLRFELIGMFDELGRIATEISGTLTSLAWDVMDYDMKLAELLVGSVGFFTLLLPIKATMVGQMALGAAALVVFKLLWDLIQQFTAKIKALDAKLETLGHKIFELRGLFNVGDNKLHLKPVGYDPNLWVPVTKEN
ncbi:hypothetical protein [Streptosporangium roseum]|uniref:Uncharacterized protein n=1 Tax=Streptosporangium roseum (strain ATCC 12428 / DSM 43021 / JCM 3005 / KCTC 9067 / NCIMB 10171 / NRRL 2505 / NI 9100) TaxID=479432 RepID=D2BBG6_STRRD|nr:hypothetical protein [Streptosporangium roseum]ACZ84189.1 hypothetical protein Sros_1191 [Streptosporangium roseum DSM 43021]